MHEWERLLIQAQTTLRIQMEIYEKYLKTEEEKMNKSTDEPSNLHQGISMRRSAA